MEEESGNLQNEFFNAMRRQRTPVAIFLANGKRLVGRVKAFDRFTILLESQHGEQMVFKHAISTVSGSAHEPRTEAVEGEGRARESAAAPRDRAGER